MDLTFWGFDWDEGNRLKCGKHGVTAGQIESVFTTTFSVRPDLAHSHTEERFQVIGKAPDGRHIFLVFTIRERDGKRYIRPISARFMHRKEVEAYEEGLPDL